MSQKVKMVVLQAKYFRITQDKELLHSTLSVSERANLLILKLNYKGNKVNFALPWRSNVPTSSKISSLVFPLPATSKTTAGHRACLDFRKMCPLPKSSDLYQKYHLNNSNDMITVLYIQKNLAQIIKQAQTYLHDYENNAIRSNWLVDIDGDLNKLKTAGY